MHGRVACQGGGGYTELARPSAMQGDYDSRGALHVATSEGKLPAVAYLLSVSAKPNQRDRWDCTPLESALEEGNFHCAKILQANGGVLGDSPSQKVIENLKYVEANVTFDDAREILAEMLRRVRLVVEGGSCAKSGFVYIAFQPGHHFADMLCRMLTRRF